MNFAAASTLMTAFGESSVRPFGSWDVAMELTTIPHLSMAQRQVGFNGSKEEDLNKSPVFGRLRLILGLPAGWNTELAYTPPVSIHGAQPRQLIALAVGRRIIERGDWTVSVRSFAQHGSVVGDITCPARLAGITDSAQNPYGCQAGSRDKIDLNYYGLDMTAGWSPGAWRWHATVGAVRSELLTQVDALVFDQRDRSRLIARDVLPYLAIGAGHQLDARLSLVAEVLHVPLSVARAPGNVRQSDPFTNLRMMLRYQFN